jgi:Tol biopolymer transport system component
MRAILLLALATAVAASAAAAVQAAHRAGNGRILFQANVFTMRPDGTGLVQLTHFTGGQVQAFIGGWSPDGKEIVWHRRGIHSDSPGLNELFVDANGGHVRQLTHMPAGTNPRGASWGPSR